MIGRLAVTIVTDVEPGAVGPPRRLQASMGKDASGNNLLPLGRLRGIHFAPALPPDDARNLKGNPLPAHRVYMSDVDGDLDTHLQELGSFFLPGIRALCWLGSRA